MKAEQIKERLKKAQEKKAKLQASLDKRNKQKEKLLLNYKMNKDLCAIISYDVFNNFKYITWAEERKGMKQNEEFDKQLREYTKQNGWNTVAQELSNYAYKMKDVVERIHNDEDELLLAEENIHKFEKDLRDANGHKSAVEELFAKIPELKTFLDMCAEKQYEFQIEYNKKLKKDWDTYYKEESKLCKCHNSRTLLDGRTMEEAGMTWGEFAKWHRAEYEKIAAIKPKRPVMSERMIKTMVESWKVQESWLMVERIKTEFGEVVSTDLHLGADGNVNGIIRGTNKSAKLETIWAGGYNIQRLHTRLLFHEF